MKVFVSICVSLAVCQLGSASIIPGQSEKQPLGDILQYESELKTLTPTQGDSSVLTSCNGVLSNPSGGIAYKAFEPVAANERCVWTIRGGLSQGFNLTVLNIGSARNPDVQVVATCLTLRTTTRHILLYVVFKVNCLRFLYFKILNISN